MSSLPIGKVILQHHNEQKRGGKNPFWKDSSWFFLKYQNQHFLKEKENSSLKVVFGGGTFQSQMFSKNVDFILLKRPTVYWYIVLFGKKSGYFFWLTVGKSTTINMCAYQKTFTNSL